MFMLKQDKDEKINFVINIFSKTNFRKKAIINHSKIIYNADA